MEYKVYYLKPSKDYDKLRFGFAESPKHIDSTIINEGLPLEEEWKSVTLQMKYGLFSDFLDTSLNLPLCSNTLKSIIEDNCVNKSEINWLPVKINDGNKLETYFFLHVPHFTPNVIDMDKSWRDEEVIFAPHFKYELIKDKDVFASDDDLTKVYFSEKLKKSIEKENLLGVGFDSWKAS
jgi:hypothetical protein